MTVHENAHIKHDLGTKFIWRFEYTTERMILEIRGIDFPLGLYIGLIQADDQ